MVTFKSLYNKPLKVTINCAHNATITLTTSGPALGKVMVEIARGNLFSLI